MAFIAWWQSYVCNLMTCLTHCKVTSRRHYICWDNMERVLANIVLPPHPHPAHDPQKMLHCHQVQFFKLLLSKGSDLVQIKIRPPCLNSCLSKQEKVKVVSEDVLPIQSWTVPLAYRSLLPLHLSGSDLSWLSQLRFKVFFCFGATETYDIYDMIWFHLIFVHRQTD